MGQGLSGSLRAICAVVALGIAGVGAGAPLRAQEAASAPAKHTSSPVSKKARKAAPKPTVAAAATPEPAADEAGSVHSILGALHLAPEPSQMPDFVRDTRPKQLDYLPITSRGEEPDRPILTPDEIRSREQELQGLRARHDKLAARAPAPAAKSAAPDPVEKKKKVQAPCLLTCTIKNRPDSMK